MKTYAIFLFDDDKEGMERYYFVKDHPIEDNQNLERDARECFAKYVLGDTASHKNFKVKVSTLDMKIKINGIKFASQTTAYIPNNGGKAVVLAERIK